LERPAPYLFPILAPTFAAGMGTPPQPGHEHWARARPIRDQPFRTKLAEKLRDRYSPHPLWRLWSVNRYVSRKSWAVQVDRPLLTAQRSTSRA